MCTSTIDEGSIPVLLKGVSLIWLKNSDGTGALAYPEHVDGDGNVKREHAFSESYAHVCNDGCIRRYGAVIGSVGDLCVNA